MLIVKWNITMNNNILNLIHIQMHHLKQLNCTNPINITSNVRNIIRYLNIDGKIGIKYLKLSQQIAELLTLIIINFVQMRLVYLASI